ncbi:MAG: nitroreductase [Peptococcaceae bacterium]|nr:nitroreductase [Peptococcaceae bacterium]
MDMKEAMFQRHTVRKYIDRPIPRDLVADIAARLQQHNEAYGLNMQLITENNDAFNAVLKLVLAKGVHNYIILAGPDTADLGEKIGYSGADMMLYVQTLGLNTWWVGGTFSRKGVEKHADLPDGQRLLGVIVVGYGQTQGVPHKSKKAADISAYQGEAPTWFQQGVTAVLLAPTALNKQAFTIHGVGNQVRMQCDNGAFSGVDLGIGKYHFELGAGKENFTWTE